LKGLQGEEQFLWFFQGLARDVKRLDANATQHSFFHRMILEQWFDFPESMDIHPCNPVIISSFALHYRQAK
jgi:hypothetical protein